MTTYKILPDHEHYCAFTLPMKSVLLALGKEIPATKAMHFYKHNLSLKSVWTNISARFDAIEEISTAVAVPDASVWVPGTLVLSDRAVGVLPDIFSYGELLPVQTPEGQYWILNCMREVNADEQHSSHTTQSGQVLDIESLQFRDEDVDRAGLFKSPFDGYRNLFCSEILKGSFLDAKLGGLKFSENLAGGFD